MWEILQNKKTKTKSKAERQIYIKTKGTDHIFILHWGLISLTFLFKIKKKENEAAVVKYM